MNGHKGNETTIRQYRNTRNSEKGTYLTTINAPFGHSAGRTAAKASLVFALTVGTVACGGSAEAGDTSAVRDTAAAFTRIINVETRPITSAPFSEVIRLTGTVAAPGDQPKDAGPLEEQAAEGAHYVDHGLAPSRRVWV